MKKIYIILLIALLIFTGCVKTTTTSLESEDIVPADAQPATDATVEQGFIEGSDEVVIASDTSLPESMSKVGFEMISGYYTRNVVQEDIDYMEMFSFEQNNFIRIATNDLEREVFAYNYKSDDFTYIYYFDGDIVAKTVLNVDTGAVLEDEAGYAELLTITAQELKQYFIDLMEAAALVPDDLH